MLSSLKHYPAGVWLDHPRSVNVGFSLAFIFLLDRLYRFGECSDFYISLIWLLPIQVVVSTSVVISAAHAQNQQQIYFRVETIKIFGSLGSINCPFIIQLPKQLIVEYGVHTYWVIQSKAFLTHIFPFVKNWPKILFFLSRKWGKSVKFRFRDPKGTALHKATF